MYNEHKDLLIQTLEGIYKNLTNFGKMGISQEQIAVVVLIDGMFMMHGSVKNLVNKAMSPPASSKDLTVLRKKKQLIYEFASMMYLYEILAFLESDKYRKEADEFYKAGLCLMKKVLNEFRYSKEKHGYVLILTLRSMRDLLTTNPHQIMEEEYNSGENFDFLRKYNIPDLGLNVSAKSLAYFQSIPEYFEFRQKMRRLFLAFRRNMESDEKASKANPFALNSKDFEILLVKEDLKKNESKLREDLKRNESKLREDLKISNLLYVVTKYDEEKLPTFKHGTRLFKHLVVLEKEIISGKGFLSCFDQEGKFDFHRFLSQCSHFAKDHFSAPSIKVKNDEEQEDLYLNSLLNNEKMKIGFSAQSSIVYQFTVGKSFFQDQKKKGNVKLLSPAANKDEVLMNVFFNVKVKNKRKLNSHLWFFKGYCSFWEPNYCCLLDCGTVPDSNGLVNFFQAFESDYNVGGVCGSMGIRLEKSKVDAQPPKQNQKKTRFQTIERSIFAFLEWVFPIARAQKFEYAVGHIIDKSFESCFGFIHVLPGAWSAYRWNALNDHMLLDENYLKSTEEKYEAKSIHEVM